jgi:hypothetical protein
MGALVEETASVKPKNKKEAIEVQTEKCTLQGVGAACNPKVS